MRLGILADIHEDAPKLFQALQLFRAVAVDQVVVLGDVVYDMGRHMPHTIDLLRDVGAVGVWGNHDLGLCHEPEAEFGARYGAPVMDFMATLRPRLEVAGCLFTHGLPHWDATDPVIFYLGDEPESVAGVADSFAATTQRVLFTGHFHRWLATRPEGRIAWDGTGALLLPADQRHLVVIGAVCEGWCATFDTASGELRPYRLPG